jgi:hypothetical protein
MSLIQHFAQGWRQSLTRLLPAIVNLSKGESQNGYNWSTHSCI